MLKRACLFITNNISKIISTVVLVIVFFSILLTISYLSSVVIAVGGDGDYTMLDIEVDYSQMYGEGGPEESSENEDKELVYDEIYEQAKATGNLISYRVELAFGDLMPTDSSIPSFNIQPVFDDKFLDFTSGNAYIVDGEYSADGILISSKFSEEYKLGIDDEIEVTDFMYIDFSELEGFEATSFNLVPDAPTHKFKITGIYDSKDYSKFVPYNGPASSHYIYVNNDKYQEVVKLMKEKSDIVEDNQFTQVSGSMPSFSRMILEMDNLDSANKVSEYVSNNHKQYIVSDSSRLLKDINEPIEEFGNTLTITIILIIVIAFIGIYLSFYLVSEKRLKEYKSLISFGAGNLQIVSQSIIELLIITICSIPLGFVAFKISFESILSLVKMYYYVIVEDKIYGGAFGGMNYGGAAEEQVYKTIDAESVVNFVEPSVVNSVIFAVAAILVVVILVAIIETIRRIKQIDRV